MNDFMYRWKIWMATCLGLALLLLAWGPLTAAQGQDSVPRYDLIEWTLPVDAVVDNPFDPDQIDVYGEFIAPDGRALIVPGFWIQPLAQTCDEDCAIEVLEPQGEPEWRVRFTPTEVGTWQYAFYVQVGGVVTALESGEFAASESDAPGFVRVAENQRYFEFDNGAAYFPIGHNLAWSWDGVGSVFAYQRWLESLAAQGGNYARLFIDIPWFISLEWEAVGDYTAAQDAAWRLDTILDTAAGLGIYLDVVLVWHQSFANAPGDPVPVPDSPPRPDTSAAWPDNPYNAINDGPLTSTVQFFTSDEAAELLQRRLRYVVARWGYSPHILAWDMFSEADRVIGYSVSSFLPWLETMTDYLRRVDVYDHLITVGADDLNADIIAAPGIDFGQVQLYQRVPVEEAVDQVLAVTRQLEAGLAAAARPLLLNEFSLNPWYEPFDVDPTGIHVQQTLWASVFAGAAGAGASWWWDTYLEPQGLTALYRPLAQFVADIPWNRLYLAATQPRLITDEPGRYVPLRLDSYERRFATTDGAAAAEYLITPDGASPPLDTLSSYLLGQSASG